MYCKRRYDDDDDEGGRSGNDNNGDDNNSDDFNGSEFDALHLNLNLSSIEIFNHQMIHLSIYSSSISI